MGPLGGRAYTVHSRSRVIGFPDSLQEVEQFALSVLPSSSFLSTFAQAAPSYRNVSLPFSCLSLVKATSAWKPSTALPGRGNPLLGPTALPHSSLKCYGLLHWDWLCACLHSSPASASASGVGVGLLCNNQLITKGSLAFFDTDCMCWVCCSGLSNVRSQLPQIL